MVSRQHAVLWFLFLVVPLSSFADVVQKAITSEEVFRVHVDDTDCRVLIAQVNLEIGNLYLGNSGKTFVGDYSLEVPLRSSKNEEGSMTLTIDRPIKDYFLQGGVLQGTGKTPQKPGQERIIVCTVIPDSNTSGTGVLILDIDTGKRSMRFNTTYEVFGKIPTTLIGE